MTDSDLVGVALIFGWAAGLVVGWWFRGFRQRWQRSHTPSTDRQRAYILRPDGRRAGRFEDLTVEQASALIDHLKAVRG